MTNHNTDSPSVPSSFWDRIDAAHGDRDAFAASLASLSQRELKQAYEQYRALGEALVTEEHGAAAGDVDDDTCRDIASWVVMQGRDVYRAVREDPTKMPRDEPRGQSFAEVMSRVYIERFGTWITAEIPEGDEGPAARAIAELRQLPGELEDEHADGAVVAITASSVRMHRCRMAAATILGLDAEGAFFAECDLSDSELVRASLPAAIFEGCSLQRAALIGAALRASTFFDCDLSGIDLTRTDVSGAALGGTSMRAATLTAVRAASADFTGCDLTRADLVAGDFRNADFRGATLDEVDWTGACVDGAHFDEGAGPPPGTPLRSDPGGRQGR